MLIPITTQCTSSATSTATPPASPMLSCPDSGRCVGRTLHSTLSPHRTRTVAQDSDPSLLKTWTHVVNDALYQPEHSAHSALVLQTSLPNGAALSAQARTRFCKRCVAGSAGGRPYARFLRGLGAARGKASSQSSMRRPM